MFTRPKCHRGYIRSPTCELPRLATGFTPTKNLFNPSHASSEPLKPPKRGRVLRHGTCCLAHCGHYHCQGAVIVILEFPVGFDDNLANISKKRIAEDR